MTRYELTAKQVAYFQRVMNDANTRITGALQLIVEEQELKGKCMLSPDLTCILVEDALEASGAAPAQANGAMEQPRGGLIEQRGSETTRAETF